MRRIITTFPVLLVLAGILTGCRPTPTAEATDVGSITNYTVRGVVLSLKPEESEVVIRHEEIPGYMMAMTMPFEVRDTNELRGLGRGDAVEFRMRVAAKDAWIDQVKKLGSDPAVLETTNAPSAVRVLPNVPDLEPGQPVPDYAFTNQLGAAFRLSDFRGKAVAVTFIFTRCPYPLFCPRMTDHFVEAQKLLRARTGGPTNWHLLSLSFDPEYDTPATLKAYGDRWKADPERWTLATGGFDQIEPFAVSVGLYFGREVSPEGQNHNLRTLVIDPQGRLAEVLVGNEWTPAELATAVTRAAAL